MAGWLVRRQLGGVARQLTAARRELGVVTEQLDHLAEDAEADELRSLVSDDPEAALIARDSTRHAASHRRQRDTLRTQIAALEARQDELLDRLNAARRT